MYQLRWETLASSNLFAFIKLHLVLILSSPALAEGLRKLRLTFSLRLHEGKVVKGRPESALP